MKRVDPSVYTKSYYLTGCTGHEEFNRSWGKELERRFRRIIKEIPSVKNKKVLDVGCGRGELVFWSIRSGAKLAVGIDYSKQAIVLSKKAKAKQNKNIKEKVLFKLMDGKKMSFKDKEFDAVFFTEVLEHLYPEEQRIVLKEIRRVLSDDGFLFLHTAPSKWFIDYTYRFWCYPISTFLVFVSNVFTKKSYDNLAKWKDLRQQDDKVMHVAEPDYFSLNKLLRETGYFGVIRSTNVTVLKPIISWKDKLFNFLVYLYPISKYFPINLFWGNDFLAVLRKSR
jgi:ubiquinone/menaquinone biosynthesis C-methylase UbiE